MTRPRLRALVLAAGYGARLRPLTHFLPKPLLPICGEPVAARTLRALRRTGCDGVALNLHHLTRAVHGFFGHRYADLELTYSVEEEILGTLGALVPLRDYLADSDAILLINSDILCAWPLDSLVDQHLRSGAEATLLLHRKAETSAYGGGVGIDAAGRIVQMRDGAARGEVQQHHVFAGAHVLSPHLLRGIKAGFADIIVGLYMPLIDEGCHIGSLLSSKPWHDLGTPRRYLTAALDWAKRERWWSWRAREKTRPPEVHGEAKITRSVIEPGVFVEANVRIEGSLVLPGAHIGEGAKVIDSVVGPGVRFPAATGIEARLVTHLHPTHPPDGRQTVMGDLVYTPL